MSRCVITLATGKDLYLNLAINLARSFLLWNKGSGIGFFIVTDIDVTLPEDIRNDVELIRIKAKEFGEGFSPKLHLDKIVAAEQTLFIDSDCLVFGNIEFIFNKFKGHPVSVLGNFIQDGEWFGDVAEICRNFNIPKLPKFNGGIYYLEKGDISTRVYTRARLLEKQYDEIGFVRLRGRPNDEVIMSLAMQLEGMSPVIDDGSVMGDPLSSPGPYKLDILKGKAVLTNPENHPKHQKWYPFDSVSPVIVHFLGYYTEHYQYKREVYNLLGLSQNKFKPITRIGGFLTIELPGKLKEGFKNSLRPFYRMIFGTRTIRKSDRI